MNTVFTKAAKKGDRVITVKNAAQYHPEVEILIGADNVGGNEIGRVKSIKGNDDHAASAAETRSSGQAIS